MKILIFNPNYFPATRYGGPVRSCHELGRALVALGHDVDVVTTNVDGPGQLDVPLGTPVDLDGVSVRYFPVAMPRRIYRSPQMKAALAPAMSRYDVVHLNGVFLWPGPMLARLAENAGVPVVLSPRGMLVPEMIAGRSSVAKKLWIQGFEHRALRSARAIHVTSSEESDGLHRLGLDLAPVVLIGNGVSGPATAPSETEIEQAWASIPKGNRVLFLGRLDWTKGVEMAVQAVAAHPQAQLLVVGPDQIGLRSRLEPLLVRNGRSAGRFLGEMGDAKWPLLAGADVLLAPSVKESFGNAVAEALVCGTPVICTEGVGAKDIVARIDPGCVIPRRQEVLDTSVAALLADPARRAGFARKARVIMRQDFSWSAIALRMCVAYSGRLRADDS